MRKIQMLAVLACLALAGNGDPAKAQEKEIVIGVDLSLTGAASSISLPERDMLDFAPDRIGGVPLRIIVLDDKSDQWTAKANARSLAYDSHADVIVGGSSTPTTRGVALIAGEAEIPQISLSPMLINEVRRNVIVGGEARMPQISPSPTLSNEARGKWSVIVAQDTPPMSNPIYDHMIAHKVKRVAFFGYDDPYGDLWYNDLEAVEEDGKLGLTIVQDQRFERGAQSVADQAQRIVAAKPDAVLVAASGRPAAVPQIALRNAGYEGPIYQTQGAATPLFLHFAGKAAEGAIITSPALMLAEKLPDSSSIKKAAMEFNFEYETKFGRGSRNVYAARMFDALEVLKRVLPAALQRAKPGTPEFRDAIRIAFLNEHNIAGAATLYNFTADDRYGYDERSTILLTVQDGKFVLTQ